YCGAGLGLSRAAANSLVTSDILTVSGTARFFEYLIFVLGRIGNQPTGRDSSRAAGPPTGEAAAATNGENEKRPARSVAADNSHESEIDVPLDLTSAVPRNGKPDLDMFQLSKVNASKRTDFTALVEQLEGHL